MRLNSHGKDRLWSIVIQQTRVEVGDVMDDLKEIDIISMEILSKGNHWISTMEKGLLTEQNTKKSLAHFKWTGRKPDKLVDCPCYFVMAKWSSPLSVLSHYHELPSCDKYFCSISSSRSILLLDFKEFIVE